MRHLHGKTISVVFISLLFATVLNANSVDLSGYARTYAGALLRGDNDYIIQNTFNLNIEHSRDKVAFKANPYIYHYPNLELDIGLREAYMDIYFNTVDIRIGKQQVIWGKADGVFITDIVSPKDLSEFLLRDFDEIRMGITSVKLDYYLGDNTFEIVWAPIFTSTQMPDENSIWRPEMDFPMAPVFDNSKKDVDMNIKNSEVFVKYSRISSVIDFEIMGGYMWDDDPAMHITKKINPQNNQLTGITVTPRHHRLGVGGGSFTSTVGPLVLRGEGAFYYGKYFNSEDMTLVDGVIEKNYIHYLAGVDFTVRDIHFSTQFVQQAILDYDEQIKNDQFENTITAMAFRDFLRETLRLELFSYIGLNNYDALVRPKITYKLTDGFTLLLGANLFVGSEGNFGQYDENDMIYLKVRYDF